MPGYTVIHIRILMQRLVEPKYYPIRWDMFSRTSILWMGLIRESMKIKKIFFGIGIHSTRWKHAGFMSLPYTWSEEQSGLQTGNIPVSLFQIILRMFRIIMNTITMNGAGKLLPVFLPICADWWMPLLPMLMASVNI